MSFVHNALVWGKVVCALVEENLNTFCKGFINCIYCLLLVPGLIFSQEGKELFNTDFVHEIRITFNQSNFWSELNNNYQDFSTFSGSDIPYLEGDISIDGTLLTSVGIRLKGKSSYYYANDKKKPFKIDFNEFIEDQQYDGLKKINLQNGIGDPGMLRDFLAFDMMRKIGVAAPRVSYCKLYINDEYWGLYEIIEQIDQTFLDNNFSKKSGNLYKNQRWSSLEWWGNDVNIYQDTFELKTNTEENDWSNFIHLLDVLNNSSETEFEDEFSRIFNIDYFLNVLAVDIFINNWDSYISNSRNFYLYDDPGSGKFHWIPWDYNLSQGGDLDTHGEPFPPYDLNCIIKADFIFSRTDRVVDFQSYAEPFAQRYKWDFGDGNESTEPYPTHEYDDSGVYNVCLTVQRDQNGEQCEQTRCKKVNLNFNPSNCNSIQDGSSPYLASDPIFQQVIAEDQYCCSEEWDVFCQITYNELQQSSPFNIEEGTSYNRDFPILHTANSRKVLINRLLEIEHIRKKYLGICCRLRDNYFNEEYLFPRIENQSALLRSAVYEDPNFLYSTDYYEYDVGNGTGGGSDAYIPALKHFYQSRFEEIDEYLNDAQFNCNDVYNYIQFQDVVINEFMASADETGTILDPSGKAEDWIELFNNTSFPIDLSDFYLSDDLDRPLKWTFPNETVLPANGYLIIWADNDLQEEELHANFKLSASGERIILSHADRSIIDIVNFSDQQVNQSLSRFPNGIGDFEPGVVTFNQFNGVSNVNELGSVDLLDIYPNPAIDHFFITLPEALNSRECIIQMWNMVGERLEIKVDKERQRKIKVQVQPNSLSPGVYRVELKTSDKIFKTKILINQI